MQERLVIHGAASHANSIGQRCDTIDLMAANHEYRIMADSGMEFMAAGEMGGSGAGADLSLLNDGRKVDALILTHSHIDHIGWTAVIHREGYLANGAPVISAPQTAEIMPYALEDGLKRSPQYTAFDAAGVLERRVVIPQPGEYEFLPGLKGFFPQCGHIGGALWIVLPTSSGRKGLIMNDWCLHDQPITKGATLPSESWPREWIPDEIWGTDLTYGSATKKPLKEEVGRLIAQTKSELARCRKVIIAAFANGRTQNIGYWLAKAGIDVWIDGAGRHIWRVLQENRWSDRDGELLKVGGRSKVHLVESEEHREELIADPKPRVIITTGGMGDFGPIIRYFEAGLSNPEWVFYFTSWLAPGTNGEKIMRGAKKLKVTTKHEESRMIEVRAAVDRFGLSAHGDLDDFVRFVEDMVSCREGKPLERIVLTHGTQETKSTAAKRIVHLTKNVIYGERNTVISLA